MKHIRVLEQSELIVTHKEGRVRSCELRLDTLSTAEHWLADTRTYWEERLDALEAYLDQNSQSNNAPDNSGDSNENS